MTERVNLAMDGGDIVEFTVRRGTYTYTFQGRISGFEINTERDEIYDIDMFSSYNRRLTSPSRTFTIEGLIVGNIGTKLVQHEIQSPEEIRGDQNVNFTSKRPWETVDYSAVPQRYVMGYPSPSETMQEQGQRLAEGLANALQRVGGCDHMCACTTECKSDCPALCGD